MLSKLFTYAAEFNTAVYFSGIFLSKTAYIKLDKFTNTQGEIACTKYSPQDYIYHVV